MGIFFNSGARRREKMRFHLQQMLRERRGSGEITPEDYAKGMKASQRNSTIEKLIAESQKSGSTESNLVGEFSWAGIWEWIQENWFEILKIVITIAILFADTQEEKALYGDGTLSAETGPKDRSDG